MSGRPEAPEGVKRTGPLYLIYVADYLLHHGTTNKEAHEKYAEKLRARGVHVQTREVPPGESPVPFDYKDHR